MPRKKLSEFRAKTIYFESAKEKYDGQVAGAGTALKLKKNNKYAVKVDQAIKKRGKAGLVKLNRDPEQVQKDLKAFFRQGFDWCLVEPMFAHAKEDERYISLRQTRDGIEAVFNSSGGIEVESAKETASYTLINDEKGMAKFAEVSGLGFDFIEGLVSLFKDNYISFLEINPLVSFGGKYIPLDMAVEVDDSATYFINSWGEVDFRSPRTLKKTIYEKVVEELAASSPASFKLEVINPNQRIFMLLSGGGASITLADEVYNQGHGLELANYGEYSGNPNREETALYTEQVLKLLINSKAKKKVLIIAGGIANFTDVKATFMGVIDALTKHREQLKAQDIGIYVRRGGPNELQGLAEMRKFIASSGLPGQVYGSQMSLTKIIDVALGGK